VPTQPKYRIVKLAEGTHSVHSVAHDETFHPVIGPVAEAEALYVRQLKLRERLEKHTGEFVIWDVGLGAAANPITVLKAVHDLSASVRIVSFEQTLEPLEFALAHAGELGYLVAYEEHLQTLLNHCKARFGDERLEVDWTVEVGDFPAMVHTKAAEEWPKPHAILFDAYSPAKNPAMWTQPLFARIYELLEPARPCAMPTYSRSTMLRVSLLLAGFFVGAGHATGEKEETTIAANTLDLLSEPLDRSWLKRARNSTSAEPLWQPEYRQAPLETETLARLEAHPQWSR
jgi:tRNA U34 5-methylaminomethyl-2-thiouridine-forming methyltransferase MnmC